MLPTASVDRSASVGRSSSSRSWPRPSASWAWARRWRSSRPGGRRRRRRSPRGIASGWSSPNSGRVRLGPGARAPSSTLDATRVWDLARQAGRRRLRGDRRRGQGLPPRGRRRRALDRRLRRRRHAGPGPGRPARRPRLRRHRPERPGRRRDRPGAPGDAGPTRRSSTSGTSPSDPKGNLYAATGPTGQLWKRSGDGKWSLLLDSKHSHLLCVAVGPDGVGLRRQRRRGPDLPGRPPTARPRSSTTPPRPRSGPSCSAPTAPSTPARPPSRGGAAGSGRARSCLSGGDRGDPASPPPGRPPGARGPPSRPHVPEGRVSASRRPSGHPVGGGAACRSPSSPGDNAVYRIGADGVAREVFRAKALIFALAWQGDRLLVGTGPEGQLYEVRDLGRESAPIAQLDNGQILALLAEPRRRPPDRRRRPGGRRPARAPATSPRGHADLRRPRHQAHQPLRRPDLAGRPAEGTSVDAPGPHRQRRRARRDLVGLVGRADRPRRVAGRVAPPAGSPSTAPRSRPRDPAVTPELRSVALRYQTANLPPEITKIDVPDVSAARRRDRGRPS